MTSQTTTAPHYRQHEDDVCRACAPEPIRPEETTETCEACGNAPAIWSIASHEIACFNLDGTKTSAPARIPVWTCTDTANCGFRYTAYGSEDANLVAVCRHIGIPTPCDILAARHRLGLAQPEFAARFGINLALLDLLERGHTYANADANEKLRVAMAA